MLFYKFYTYPQHLQVIKGTTDVGSLQLAEAETS
jgi:hypothetical protein